MTTETKTEQPLKKWIVIASWPGAVWKIGDIVTEGDKLDWKGFFKLDPDNYPHLFKRIES